MNKKVYKIKEREKGRRKEKKNLILKQGSQLSLSDDPVLRGRPEYEYSIRNARCQANYAKRKYPRKNGLRKTP